MSVQIIGVIAIFVLLLLMTLRVPVAYAMMAVSLVGLAVIRGWNAGVQIVAMTLYDKFTSYSFSAIPMFILLGFLAYYAGILEVLFDTAKKWIGHIPGGLVIAGILGGAGFGAVCGSGNAASATLSRMIVPELIRNKTDKPLAYGAISSAGILAPLIPPSVIAMLIAVVLEVSIGKVLIGGLMPGLLLTLLFSIYIYVAVKLDPKKAPLSQKSTWKERFVALPRNWDFAVIILIIIVGIYTGIFSATEAGAVSSAAIIIILIIKRKFSLKLLWRSLKDTMITTCSAFFIVGTAFTFGSFLTLTRIPNALVNWLVELSVPPLVIIFAIAIFFTIIGMFMDVMSVIYITVPILAPVVSALGYDLVWFAVLLLVLTAVAAISPPFGGSLFVMKASIEESTMGEIYKGAMPFFLVSLAAIVICILFPQFILVLPNLMGG
ncbi:MAG: TRAP transporter large permease [Oscillospiraceae bacterium]|jgi:C4-dicarboxylate transporter DctM subunit